MNSEKNKNLVFVILILAFIVLGFFLGKAGKRKRNNHQISEIINYKDTVMFYKSKSGELIAYNNSLNVSYQNLKKTNDSLIKQVEDLKIKKPTIITTVKTEVIVKEVYIPYTTELPCDSFSISFNFNDNWISIDGNSSNHGLRFDSIKLTNDMFIVTGVKRNGLFKPSETIVAVKSSNPYFNLTGLQNYTIVEEKRFYNKLWFKGLIFTGGIFTGIIISR